MDYCAYVVLACQKSLLEGKIPDEDLAAFRITIARSLLKSKKHSKQRIINFLHFLKNIIFVNSEQLNQTLDSYIKN